MRQGLPFVFAALALSLADPAAAQSLAGKKILFVNSYHAGYPWSDGEEKGAALALERTGVTLEFARMDAKNHGDDAFRKAAGLKVKAQIEAQKPDVVIVADDVAVQYVLQPFFKDAAVPFVFCGLNWDATRYGLPYRNATGMVEVSTAKELLAVLRGLSRGARVGYLTADSETERFEVPAQEKQIGTPFAVVKYAKTFAQWKAGYLDMQKTTDILFLGNYAGITDWNDAEARAVVRASSTVPTGTAYDFMMPYSMLGMIKIDQEQGIAAGKMALKILRGAAPSSIPVVANKQSKILINPKLAAVARVVFKPDIVRAAEVVQ